MKQLPLLLDFTPLSPREICVCCRTVRACKSCCKTCKNECNAKQDCTMEFVENAVWWNSIVRIFRVDEILKYQPDSVKKWLKERMV